MRLRYMSVIVAAAVALGAGEALAKRVIWVGNSNEAENAGQHYAQNPQPGDIIQREAAGTSLATARGKIANNDTFIIITHGLDGTISVGGNSRDGFRGTGTTGDGTGAGCNTPVELDPITETNVTIILHVCHSEDDPDGAGNPQSSVADSLREIVTGAGSTVTGKAGTVSFTCSFTYSNPAAPNATQLANLTQCKADAAAAAGFNGPNRINDWVGSLGGAAKQAAVSAAITACRNSGVDLPDQTYQYTQPSAPGNAVPIYEHWEPREIILPHGGSVIPETPVVVVEPCGGDCAAPGIIPTASEWGMIIMAGCLLLGGGFILRRSIV